VSVDALVFFQAEGGIRGWSVTGVQTCALPIFAPIDIDGDGLPELVLGAAWKPFDTANAAQLVWLKRGKDVTQEWTMHELPCDERSEERRVGKEGGCGGSACVAKRQMECRARPV